MQPRKRENHYSVPAASQNSQQQNVDFVVFVAALLHPCIPASMHRSIHPSMHPECIKICSDVLYQMAPSTWKVQPRKRENHCSVPPAPQNSQQQNVDFVVFVAALSCGRHFLGHCMHLHASTHPCIPASMHRSIHPSSQQQNVHLVVFVAALSMVREPFGKGQWNRF